MLSKQVVFIQYDNRTQIHTNGEWKHMVPVYLKELCILSQN